MTEEERKEAGKSFRVAITFWKWHFIIFGNWKREIIRLSGNISESYRGVPFFKIWDWHPFKPKKSLEYRL